MAVLAAGAWRVRPKGSIDEERGARLREAVVDQEHEARLRALIPPGARVLQVGGVGLGHNAALWDATAVGDVKWAKREHAEVDYRERAFFLPESFTHVVVRELDEVEHKDVVLQDAHKWLEPEGVLVLHTAKRESKGDVKWRVREWDDRRTETVTHQGKSWSETKKVYRETAATVEEMVRAAGFVREGQVYVKAVV